MAGAEQSGSGGSGPKPVVCFLGPTSSYTHQATMSAFPEDRFELMPVTTIKDIFDTTQSGAAKYGVVPFENSTNGSVVFTLDNFADRSDVYPDLNVCQEIYLDVHHCLLGHAAAADREEGETGNGGDASGQRTPTALNPHSLSHVRRVYSHPQAFGQCMLFLDARLRGVETVDVSSTSRAAHLAKEDPTGESAAISSAVAAKALGLDVLARNIEDRQDNTTRFFVLRRGIDGESPSFPSSSSQPGGAREKENVEEEDDDAQLLSSTKSLLSFTVPHRSPGALADVLSCFRRGGLNLTSINSRPSLIGPFEYIFFVEFEGHRFRDPRGRVTGVLDEIAAIAGMSRWLGSWENMRRGPT
ncbi:Prephenate dehydratase-domain-containing protein [Xylaria sp. CBS 124048]|nr:Prephenate dehydratase-domain-containing protein [Xylaria sp. CBS 124048]